MDDMADSLDTGSDNLEYNPVDDIPTVISNQPSWLTGITDIGNAVSQVITTIGNQQTNLISTTNAPAIAKTTANAIIANSQGINGLIPIVIIIGIIYFIGRKVI